jgi:hypothetical protein
MTSPHCPGSTELPSGGTEALLVAIAFESQRGCRGSTRSYASKGLGIAERVFDAGRRPFVVYAGLVVED